MIMLDYVITLNMCSPMSTVIKCDTDKFTGRMSEGEDKIAVQVYSPLSVSCSALNVRVKFVV